nr:hypothetical protein [Candidatus Minimicrobia vallesae]
MIMGSAGAGSVSYEKIGAKAGILYAGTLLHAMPIQRKGNYNGAKFGKIVGR